MRIGLVGYGHGGRFFHAPLLSSLPGATFVGVVTRSAERRQLLATEYPGVPAFDSIGQLVEAGVDVLVISTPLKGRPALVLDGLEHGVMVVSDKPFAADAQQAQTLITMAERQGVRLSVYQNRRWDSDFLTVRKLIEFGPVSRVYGELDHLEKEQAYDSGFFVSLTHASGVISHLGGSCLQNSPGPRFRVTGTQGCYSVDGLDGQEAQALAGLSPKSAGERWGVEEHRRWGWFEQGEIRERVPSERGCWNQFYLQLQTALHSGGPLPVEARDALATTRVLDAARLSAERGQVVDLQAFGAAGANLE